MVLLVTIVVNVNVSVYTFNAKKGETGIFRSVCFDIRSIGSVKVVCAGKKSCATVLGVEGPVEGCSTSGSDCCSFVDLFSSVLRLLKRNCTLRGRSIFIHGRFSVGDVTTGKVDSVSGHFLSSSCFEFFRKEDCMTRRAFLVVAEGNGGKAVRDCSPTG